MISCMSDDPHMSGKVHTRGRGNLPEFLDSICRQQGISLRTIARETGVNVSTLSRWREGKQMPSPESCRMLADFLALPVKHVFAMAGYFNPHHRENNDSVSELHAYAG